MSFACTCLEKKIFNVPVVSLVSQPAVAVSTIAVLLLLSVEVAMKAAVVFEVDFVALRTQLLLAEVVHHVLLQITC